MEHSNGSKVHLAQRSIDTARPLRVVVVGAGISGVINAIKLTESIEKLDLVIFEKNAGLGGTWYENRYPGGACDIPAHVYQLSWDSNVAWSRFYASGSEILQYWQRVADKYDVEKHMRFSHRVVEARWSGATWTVTVEDMLTGRTMAQEADVLITAIGVLNRWEWPHIPGLMDFEGKMMHSAKWDEEYDMQDKTCAVIGAGSSGIQIVPSIQPKVRRLHHYVRGRTWIATPFAAREIQNRGIEGSNFEFTPDEIKGWQADPSSYLRYRKLVEEDVQSGYDVTLRGSESQAQAKEYFRMLMAQRLSKKPELLEHFLPTFSPLCKRLTPGPGYLEALTEPNVDVIVDPIDRVTKTGILTQNGVQRDVDAIICATGFNTHFTNQFPIYGVDGKELFDQQEVHGFPNLFMCLGPNAGVGHGNLLMILERIADYTVKALRKMQTEGIHTLQPSVRAMNSFTELCDTYFERTVFSEECSSWYKTEGRVSALWPGSSLHAIKAFQNPRWEDFEYTYEDGNEVGWLGDGSTEADHRSDMDKSYYLTSVDLVKDDLRNGHSGRY